MPSKEQADILIAKYFEVVDGVYPFLHRRTFYADYERFWALPAEKRGEMDLRFAKWEVSWTSHIHGQFPNDTERSARRKQKSSTGQ